VLDELPSLELAATAVAVVLALRALVLFRKVGLVRGRARVESARARDLIGVAILAAAVLYAIRVERASSWFLAAISLAILAQLLGFFLVTRRAGATVPPPSPREGLPAAAAAVASPSRPSSSADGPEIDFEEEDELSVCPSCGHGALIEIDEGSKLLAGLSAYTAVVAVICPSCGAISGHVEDPAKIPIDAAQGTTLRQGPNGSDQEALQEPAEHDG
jgi:hypothetical protein